MRSGVGLFDGSSLGKIEVNGPDAAAFLNIVYYNEVANLKPDRIRYALLLRETGIVYDDGVVARLAPDRYLLSPSSSHTQGVLALLEAVAADRVPDAARGDARHHRGLGHLRGRRRRARASCWRRSTDIDISHAALPHMALAHGNICGVAGRIARVSFSGERSYEVSVPSGYAVALWRRLLLAGEAFGVTPYGVETSSLLRAEKGYILIGVDTDGMTLPDDLGMSGPLRTKKVDFVGKRSLLMPDARRPDRRQFVGLLPEDASAVPAVGAHAVARGADGKRRSIGWVTSAFHSPVARPLDRARHDRARAGAGGGGRGGGTVPSRPLLARARLFARVLRSGRGAAAWLSLRASRSLPSSAPVIPPRVRRASRCGWSIPARCSSSPIPLPTSRRTNGVATFRAVSGSRPTARCWWARLRRPAASSPT